MIRMMMMVKFCFVLFVFFFFVSKNKILVKSFLSFSVVFQDLYSSDVSSEIGNRRPFQELIKKIVFLYSWMGPFFFLFIKKFVYLYFLFSKLMDFFFFFSIFISALRRIIAGVGRAGSS